jgi:hypothetical protein
MQTNNAKVPKGKRMNRGSGWILQKGEKGKPFHATLIKTFGIAGKAGLRVAIFSVPSRFR